MVNAEDDFIFYELEINKFRTWLGNFSLTSCLLVLAVMLLTELFGLGQKTGQSKIRPNYIEQVRKTVDKCKGGMVETFF